ncbi:MAG: hypothetical protein ACI4L9_04975 [Candidatus Coproplasma sp.]
MKEFKVSFALSDSEYLTAVRLVVGAICSSADSDLDAAEDFKVCVTESCIILKNCGFENVEISFGINGGVSAVVCGSGGEIADGDNEFSLALISALVSSCEIERTGEAISKISLKL